MNLPTRHNPDEIAPQISMLAAYFGAELDPTLLRLYVDAVRGVQPDDLRAGCRRLITTARFMPKVAEILEAVEVAVVDRHEAAQRQAREAARIVARVPFSLFGRMSKAAVLHAFRGFVADEVCTCVACFDAGVTGPPRFVPDGQSPPPACLRCDDRGWTEAADRSDTAGPAMRRCGCVGSNPNLVAATREHVVDMGRWLHGAALREHEQAQAAYEAAMRGWVARSRRAR